MTRISLSKPPTFLTPSPSAPSSASAGSSQSMWTSLVSDEREGAYLLAAQRRFQVLAALGVGAVAVDEVGAHQRLHGGDRRQRERPCRQLFVEHAAGGEVGALAAHLLGVAEAQVAELRQPLEQRVRKLAMHVEVRRAREDFFVYEGANRIPERKGRVGDPGRIFGACAAHLRRRLLCSSVAHQPMRFLWCSAAPCIWATQTPNLSAGPPP